MKFNWRRSLVLGISLFALAIGTALVPIAWSAYREYRATRVVPIVASDGEFQSVLHVILSNMKFEGEPPPPPELNQPPRVEEQKPVVVIAQTVAFCDAHEQSKLNCQPEEESILYPAIDSEIPAKFRRELVAANRISDPFTCPESNLVKCAKPDAVFKSLARGASWHEFYSKFPNTAGYIYVGKVVLSPDKETALTYVAYGCGAMCGEGILVLLKRTDVSTWVIVKQVRTWVV